MCNKQSTVSRKTLNRRSGKLCTNHVRTASTPSARRATMSHQHSVPDGRGRQAVHATRDQFGTAIYIYATAVDLVRNEGLIRGVRTLHWLHCSVSGREVVYRRSLLYTTLRTFILITYTSLYYSNVITTTKLMKTNKEQYKVMKYTKYITQQTST